MQPNLTIAHISDLHIGDGWLRAPYDRVLLRHLTKHLIRQKPDIIICAGDLVDTPLSTQGLRHAKRFLDQLAASLKECAIRIVPGNHDVAIKGIVGIKSVFLSRFEREFSDYLLKPDTPYITNKVAIFGFDSNPRFARFAKGQISDREIKTFCEKMDELKDSRDFPNLLKVAVLHHHPLPIPQSGSDTLLALENAGSLLQVMGKQRVDLVLHGHKHYSASAKVAIFSESDGENHSLIVLGAGSAARRGGHEPKGNMYNVVRLWEDGSITLEQFFVRSREAFPRECSAPLQLRTPEEALRVAVINAKEVKDLTIKRIDLHVELNEFGDGDYTLTFAGLIARSNCAVRESILTRHSSYGSFAPFKISSEELPAIGVKGKFERVDRESTEAVAIVEFGEPLTEEKGPVNCKLETSIYGGFAVNTAEQSQRRIKHVEGMEWISYTVEHPVEELRMSLYSQALNFAPSSVDVAVVNRSGLRQNRLEALARETVEVESHLVRCRIRDPRIGFRYELRWRLPDPPLIEGKFLDIAYELRRCLIEAAEGGPTSKLAQHLSNWISETRLDYLRKFGKGLPENIEVSLQVLDDTTYRLKLVASMLPQSSPVWEWEGFKPGTGLAGRAYKCNRVAFYSTLRGGEDQNVYIKHADPTLAHIDLVPHEVLLSCPLYFGGSSRDHIIAIMNIGSDSRASQLHTYFAPRPEIDAWLKDTTKSALRCLTSLLTPHSESEIGLSPS